MMTTTVAALTTGRESKGGQVDRAGPEAGRQGSRGPPAGRRPAAVAVAGPPLDQAAALVAAAAEGPGGSPMP